jgi:hypothetical protein
MPINFIVNDPLALNSVPMRQKEPLANRKSGEAGFTFAQAAPAGLFDPGNADFLFWQSREAALTAIQMWEALNGPLSQWGPETENPDKLNLLPDVDDNLNAFYDRSSLSFFHHTIGAQTFFSGASTDVVAHESGHAFLDTLRPELFGTSITEHGAFHEAFGDCTALLTALFDQGTRQALIAASPNLGTPNFVESLSEELSSAVKEAFGPNHPAAEPRHALNDFKFQLPTALPRTGPPPMLTSEIHSFGRVFVGCFYDMIRNIFQNASTQDEATLFSVAQTAASLLIAGAKQAETSPRFFQSIGRAIVLADQTMNGGTNRQAISDAFSRHGILLGTMAALMPKASLAGPAPRATAKAKALSLAPETLKDIKKRIEAPAGSKFSFQALTLGDREVVQAVHQREVRLDQHGKELKGVVAYAPEPVIVGGVEKVAAVFNILPDPSTTEDEVHAFVETLLTNDDISFEPKKRAAKGLVQTSRPKRNLSKYPSHIVAVRKGKKVLTRVRYFCC